jgi:hypothetical protein
MKGDGEGERVDGDDGRRLAIKHISPDVIYQ